MACERNVLGVAGGDVMSGTEQRAHEILYSCDSREELAERIVALEDYARELWATVEWMDGMNAGKREELRHKLRELLDGD